MIFLKKWLNYVRKIIQTSILILLNFYSTLLAFFSQKVVTILNPLPLSCMLFKIPILFNPS